MTPAVRAAALVKRYGEFTAVDALDLDVECGQCFGILGPNGAGKTTTIRMITCVSPPTSGRLEVLGEDVRRNRRALKRRLGVVPQGMTLDKDITVRENLTVHAGYHGIPRKLAEERADELLQFAQLVERAEARIQQLSGGMQRRLLIARALVNDPELVVLDEPTTGLDPQARHLVWERLRALRRQGKTLLITTHYMEEAARLCDRVLILDSGRVIADGTPDELVEQHVSARVVEVNDVEGLRDIIRTAVDGLASDLEFVGDRALAYGYDGEAILTRLKEFGVDHKRVILREADLEDVFLRLTGHALVD